MTEADRLQQLCQAGKAQFFEKDATPAQREQGLALLLEAQQGGDPEASYLIATLILEEALAVRGCDPEDHAMYLMAYAADRGYLPAKTQLNAICTMRYRQSQPEKLPAEGPLTDFDGKPIAVKREGFFTPVDAVLSYENGENILTLSTNVRFVYAEDIPDPDAFENAVLAGFREWSGTYRVFGGQKLQVRVDLSLEDKFYDHLTVLPVTRSLNRTLQQVAGALGNEQMQTMAVEQRSFASLGVRWTANSRKTVWIQGDPSDLAVVRQTAKHEFGHVLGLGDLYESEDDQLSGVREGTYPELDCYAVTEKLYHLVMCSSAGPVSNNDIEMVVLAFRDNALQIFQSDKRHKKISEALGKGN